MPRRLALWSLLVLAAPPVGCAKKAAAKDDPVDDGPNVAEICRVDEFACEGGVLVDMGQGRPEECWRVGRQGESCDEVCGMSAMVDQRGTIVGSGLIEVIECLEAVKAPEVKARACPPIVGDFEKEGECERRRRDAFAIEGSCDTGITLLIDVIEKPRWHCYPQFRPTAVPQGFRAPPANFTAD